MLLREKSGFIDITTFGRSGAQEYMDDRKNIRGTKKLVIRRIIHEK